MTCRRAKGLIPITLVLWTVTSSVPAAEPLPYRLQVELVYGEPAGPENLRDELEYEVVATLRAAGCFGSVMPHLAPPVEPTDLRLVVTVNRFDENIAYEMSIAERASPTGSAGADQRRVARISAGFEVDLTTLAESAPVRRKSFRLAYAWRPVHGEDPRQKVQRDLLTGAGRKLRSFVCQGSARSLREEIARAREAASSRTR